VLEITQQVGQVHRFGKAERDEVTAVPLIPSRNHQVLVRLHDRVFLPEGLGEGAGQELLEPARFHTVYLQKTHLLGGRVRTGFGENHVSRHLVGRASERKAVKIELVGVNRRERQQILDFRRVREDEGGPHAPLRHAWRRTEGRGDMCRVHEDDPKAHLLQRSLNRHKKLETTLV